MAKQLLIAFLLLDGVAIFGIWGINLAGGAFADGLLVYRDGNLPILHLAAEFLMAGAALTAGIALWAGARWGRGLALFALGTLAYSGINSLGWALHNDPVQAIPMALTLVGVALAVPYLLRREKVETRSTDVYCHRRKDSPRKRLRAQFGRPARTPITPEMPFTPPSLIALIKAHVDEMLMGSGLPVTVVHLPDFYGPGVVNPLVKPLFENALAGKDITFPAPVDVPHQFIYIEDAAQALVAVAGREVCYGRRYTVGGVEPITVRRFAEMIYREAGTEGKVRGMPPWLLRLAGMFSAEARAAPGIVHVFAWDTTMDGSALRQDTGFTPEIGYEEGIRRTTAWFR